MRPHIEKGKYFFRKIDVAGETQNLFLLSFCAFSVFSFVIYQLPHHIDIYLFSTYFWTFVKNSAGGGLVRGWLVAFYPSIRSSRYRAVTGNDVSFCQSATKA